MTGLMARGLPYGEINKLRVKPAMTMGWAPAITVGWLEDITPIKYNLHKILTNRVRIYYLELLAPLKNPQKTGKGGKTV
jgi:hypothetical protein